MYTEAKIVYVITIQIYLNSLLINNLRRSAKGDMLIVGDFNLGDNDWEIYTAPKSNLSSQLFIRVLRDNLLTQLVDNAFRACTDTPRILDLVYHRA